MDHNVEERNQEAVKAERIIDEAVVHFRAWQASLEVIPTIVALRSKLGIIADTEVKKTLQSLHRFSEADQDVMCRMKTALINKILHQPTLFLKQNVVQSEQAVYLDTVRKMFHLDENSEEL